jgi:branched-chain amino acid aminotransferase
MDKGEFIWKDGEIFSWDDERAKVHVSNHSLNYGSAVFEGIRFYETPGNENGNSAIFRLEDHVERLFYSASVIGNDLGKYSRREISDAIIETVKINGFKEGYIRPIVFFSAGIGIDWGNKYGEIAIMVLPWERYLDGEGVRAYIPEIRKTNFRTTDIDAKISGNYQNSILAHFEAKKKGYGECLLLDCKAEIAEGPGENIFFVKKKKLITPPRGNILPGITRDTILKLGPENGFEIEERIVHHSQIDEMDEAFFCGTAVEVTPISEIGEAVRIKPVKYNTHEVTDKIKELYMNTVRGKNNHLEWLTFV